jgi:hypothetical protein
MEFKHVPEPYLSEIQSYVRQRREYVTLFSDLDDVRSELLRSLTPGQPPLHPVDMYPKARQLITDDEYIGILRDMFNLSNVLDDMEHTGCIPYQNRGHYYNVYSRLYRMLVARAKHAS